MKRNQFSYLNVRALSHASLEKFRQSAPKQEPAPQETFNAKPAIKYYSNSNENNSTVAMPLKGQKKAEVASKSKVQQQLKKKIKLLQYELRKKISEHSHLAKLFKTKNSSEVPHIDLYLEFSQLEQELESKTAQLKERQKKSEQYCQEIEQLLAEKDSHEAQHTNEIKSFLNKLEKLEKKHAQELSEKERAINDERRAKEEKDVLLKEFRRKYEECQAVMAGLQREMGDFRDDREELERIYEEKIENTREDFIMRLEDSSRELQKYAAKLREQEQTIKQLRDHHSRTQSDKDKLIKTMEADLNAKTKLLTEQEGYLLEFNKQCEIYQKELSEQQRKEKEVADQITRLRGLLKEKEEAYKRQAELMRKEIGQCKTALKESQTKSEKYCRQLNKAEHKLAESATTLKALTFDSQDKNLSLQKTKQRVLQKQKQLEEQQKALEELECRLFNAERKSTASFQRVRELEKELAFSKDAGSQHSKIEIQHYKCMGRLMELIHQVQGLIAEGEGESRAKVGSLRNRTKGNESDEPQTISQCVDVLTRQLQIFTKKHYSQAIQQNKNSQQLISQITSDIKSLFHAYNSYIQDEELKGATREYLECLDSTEKSQRKNRNNYLQVIMERLISMIAIQSYTSEKGLQRRGQSKGKVNRGVRDSLESSCGGWDEDGERDRVELRAERRKTLESSLERFPRVQSKKKAHKLLTEQNEVQSIPIRRLEYGKQNYMQRINRAETTDITGYTSRLETHTAKYYGDYNSRHIPAMNRQAGHEDLVKEPRKEKKVSEAELIEKKYFR